MFALKLNPRIQVEADHCDDLNASPGLLQLLCQFCLRRYFFCKNNAVDLVLVVEASRQGEKNGLCGLGVGYGVLKFLTMYRIASL